MKRLLPFLILFLLATTTLSARTYIVSVGIADYPGRQNDLRVSANDAKTISGIFTKNGNATVDCFVNSDVTIKKVCTAMRIPVDTRSLIPVISVHSISNLQYRRQS